MRKSTISLKKIVDTIPITGTPDVVGLVEDDETTPGKQSQNVDSPALITVSMEQLQAMIADAVKAAQPTSIENANSRLITDPTMDLPTGDIPRHLIADKSSLPPAGERAASPIQPPARLWGKHIAPSPIQSQVQPGIHAGSSISPPPMRHFGKGQ